MVCRINGAGRRQTRTPAGRPAKETFSFLQVLKDALRSCSYWYLMIGFATCGFHMSLIQNHFYSQMISYGIDRQTAAFAYTMFGIGTMAGALLCGLICSRLPLKNVLSMLYLSRAAVIAVFFFLLPKNLPAVMLFAIVLGLCGDATVTPTSEIISRKFGPARMAFLFGTVFVCHQTGAFFSTWLTGILLRITGSYLWVWILDSVLCILAAAVSFRIHASDAGARSRPEA